MNIIPSCVQYIIYLPFSLKETKRTAVLHLSKNKKIDKNKNIKDAEEKCNDQISEMELKR